MAGKKKTLTHIIAALLLALGVSTYAQTNTSLLRSKNVNNSQMNGINSPNDGSIVFGSANTSLFQRDPNRWIQLRQTLRVCNDQLNILNGNSVILPGLLPHRLGETLSWNGNKWESDSLLYITNSISNGVFTQVAEKELNIVTAVKINGHNIYASYKNGGINYYNFSNHSNVTTIFSHHCGHKHTSILEHENVLYVGGTHLLTLNKNTDQVTHDTIGGSHYMTVCCGDDFLYTSAEVPENWGTVNWGPDTFFNPPVINEDVDGIINSYNIENITTPNYDGQLDNVFKVHGIASKNISLYIQSYRWIHNIFYNPIHQRGNVIKTFTRARHYSSEPGLYSETNFIDTLKHDLTNHFYGQYGMCKVSDDHLYVVKKDSLTILNISDSTLIVWPPPNDYIHPPKIESSFPYSNLSDKTIIKKFDDQLFLLTVLPSGSERIEIFDISNPLSPTSIFQQDFNLDVVSDFDFDPQSNSLAISEQIGSHSGKIRLYKIKDKFVGISTKERTHDLNVNGNASKQGGGNWLGYSDKRLKKNIKPYTKGLDVIRNINPYQFNYRSNSSYSDTTSTFTGVLAQEMQHILPESVKVVKNGKGDPKNTLQFDSSSIIYNLINALQEIKKEQDLIEHKINTQLNHEK